LIYVDCMVGLKDWSRFEEFVFESKFRSDTPFMQGVCLRLEQIAARDIDETVRLSAIKFLKTLGAFPIPPVQHMANAALKRLQNYGNRGLMSAYMLNFSTNNAQGALPLEQGGDLLPVWDPRWYTTCNNNLLKATQDKIKSVSRINDVNSALQKYYSKDLRIQRVSGETLPLDSCYINLAIVESPAQRQEEKRELKSMATTFNRLPSYERIVETNTQASISLEEIFHKCKLRDGRLDSPRTILIQGRAGIGKTTLCKKIVHTFQSGLWRDQFDAVLWIPLRMLRSFNARNLNDLLCEVFFCNDRDPQSLATTLRTCAENGRVLFILDGLDEILIDTQHEKFKPLEKFLENLLQQTRVVITSRPSGVDLSKLPILDLELETIGFNSQNISDYLSKVLNMDSVKTVQDFIQKSLLIQGLVNIPIQLDVICYIWDSLPSNDSEISMTKLYQTLVRKLWCKDGLRVRKEHLGSSISAQQYEALQGYQIDKLMADETEYLRYLAFSGMQNGYRIEFDSSALRDALKKLDLNRQSEPHHQYIRPFELLPFNLFDTLKQTSFLHSADAGLDDGKDDPQRSWHFLHLTFQEYFAASWLVQHLQPSQWDMKKESKPMMTKDEARAFIQDHKYDPRFEIVLWMVAGQLKGEPLESFFSLLQEAPRDLIGGRHQKILAGCLKESRAQLNAKMVANLEAKLMQWLHFDMTLHGDVTILWDYGRESILGKQWVIPEELLFKCLNQSKKPMIYALKALGSRPYLASSFVNDLIPYLDYVDEDIKMSTISVLGVQDILDNSVIEVLVSILTDQSAKPEIKQAAARALSTQRSLPEIAILALYYALDDLNDVTLCSAARSLGKLITLRDAQATLNDPIISAFISTINGGCRNSRISAIEGLGTQPKLPEVVVLSIISVMRDRDWIIKSVAASALCSYRSLPASAISALINALGDEDLEFSCSAARVLGSQVTLSESTILVLVDALCHKEWSVRKSAAEALGTQATLSEYAVQALIAATGDGKDYAIRGLAVKALCFQTIPSKDIVDAIYSAVQDQEPLPTIHEPSQQPESTISALIGIFQSNNWKTIKEALNMLSFSPILPESAISALITALSSRDWKVRKLAAETLGSQSVLPESAIMTLIKAFKDKVSSVAEFDTLALVIALYDKGQSQGTKRLSVSVLGIQINLPESSIHALNSALDSDSDVRRSAAHELSTESQLHEITIRTILDVLNDKGSLGKAKGVQQTLSEYTMLSLNSDICSNLLGAKGPVSKVPDAPQSLSEISILNLIGNLHNSNWHVKKSAAIILEDQVLLLESAIQALVDTLQNKDWSVKKSAAEILGTQSPLPDYAIMALIRATQDTSRSVRRAAVEAIGSQDILPESTIVALLGALRDDDLGVVDSAARVLDAHYTALKNTNIPSTASKGEAVKYPGTDGDNWLTVLRSSSVFNKDELQTITEVTHDHSWSANIPSSAPMALDLNNIMDVLTSISRSTSGVLHQHGKDIKAIVAESLISRPTLPESLEELLIGVLHSDASYSNGQITETQINFPLPKSVTSTLVNKLREKNGEEAVGGVGNLTDS
ncbi:hypothetical protein BGX27_000218, partial [Mortierella sp. AM989]